MHTLGLGEANPPWQPGSPDFCRYGSAICQIGVWLTPFVFSDKMGSAATEEAEDDP